MDDFVTQIDKIVVNTEARLLAVARSAIRDVVNDTQKLKTDGGRMPVRTGFLWSSGGSSLNSMPVGAVKGDKTASYNWVNSTFELDLAKMKLGDVFYWGWTAVYANMQNTRNGFLEFGTDKWEKYVNKAVQYWRDKDARNAE